MIEELTDVPLTGTVAGLDGVTYTYTSLITFSPAFSVKLDPFVGPYSKSVRIKMTCSVCSAPMDALIT